MPASSMLEIAGVPQRNMQEAPCSMQATAVSGKGVGDRACSSADRKPSMLERMQSNTFVRSALDALVRTVSIARAPHRVDVECA